MEELEHLIRVYAVGDCAGFAHMLEQLGDVDGVEMSIGEAELGPIAIEPAAGGSPDVVMLAVSSVDARFQDAFVALQASTSSPVVLVAPAPTAELLDVALEIGAFDVVATGSTVEAVSFVVRRAAQASTGSLPRVDRAPQARPAARGRVISLFSTKGGVGTTTVAVNIAASFASRSALRTLLIDLDLVGGDAALLFGITPRRTIVDVALSQGDLDAGKLAGFVTRHQCGLDILAAPIRQRDGVLVRPERVLDIVGVARDSYDVVVIDMQRHLDDTMYAALDRTDDVLVVATPDIATVRGARESMELLAEVQFPSEHCHLTMNRAGSSVGMGMEEVERVLGVDARYAIPSDRLVPLSGNQGTPVTLAAPRGAVATSIAAIADDLVASGARSRRRAGRAQRMLPRIRRRGAVAGVRGATDAAGA